MKVWKLIEDHYPLRNPEIKELREQLQVMVALVCWATELQRWAKEQKQEDGVRE